MLIERNGCIFDDVQLAGSHGYENLDPVAQEVFVNHIHLDGSDREQRAENITSSWVNEMQSKWPTVIFRIYRHCDADEVTVRFHVHRPEFPDWCEDIAGVSITTVNGQQ